MNQILKIKITKHFNFNACLKFLDRGYDECLYEVTSEYVRRLIRISSGLILIQVTSDDDYLYIEADKNTAEFENIEIEAYVNDWFDTNRDISGFYHLIDSHKQTKEFSNCYYGLRLMGIVDLFEALCWCVIGQQINLTFAHKIKKRFVHQFGEHVNYQGKSYYSFPTPQILSHVDKDVMVNMQFSKQKISYIQNITKAFCDKEFNKQQLKKLPPEQQMQQLLAIKGIGPWTANYVSMKSLRNMSCIAYGDTGLSAALHRHFKTEKKPDYATIDKIFQPFSGWESYLNFYLWKSLS